MVKYAVVERIQDAKRPKSMVLARVPPRIKGRGGMLWNLGAVGRTDARRAADPRQRTMLEKEARRPRARRGVDSRRTPNPWRTTPSNSLSESTPVMRGRELREGWG